MRTDIDNRNRTVIDKFFKGTDTETAVFDFMWKLSMTVLLRANICMSMTVHMASNVSTTVRLKLSMNVHLESIVDASPLEAVSMTGRAPKIN
jgi:hypothetical protein